MQNLGDPGTLGPRNVMEPKVAEALTKVFGEGGRKARIDPLMGGITNRNFTAEVAGRRVVVRVAGQDTHLLGIDRRWECETAASMAKAGLAPPVLHADSEAGVLVCEFVEGRTLTPEALRDPLLFRRVVEAIREIHRLKRIPGSFSPFRTVGVYEKAAAERGVRLPANVKAALLLSARIEGALGSRPLKPCHNDLLPGNFIDDGERLWIVDWEYAGMGDPAFDLGNFAINLELNAADCRRVVEIYGSPSPEADLARLQLMRVASDLREAFWGFVQSAVSSLEFDFLGYGEKHLKRALASAAAAEMETWLVRAGT